MEPRRRRRRLHIRRHRGRRGRAEITQKSLNAALNRALAFLQKIGVRLNSETKSKSKLPDWAGGIGWKKVLIAHGPRTGVLLLETLFLRCSVLVEHAAFDDASSKAAGCDGAFICLSDRAELEPAAHLCRKLREADKTKPVCVIVDSNADTADQFPEITVLKDPVSLSSILDFVRKAPHPAPRKETAKTARENGKESEKEARKPTAKTAKA